MNYSRGVRCFCAVVLVAVVCTIVVDTRSHFDQGLVDLKIKHRSAQRHWNVYFSQNQVFFNSSLRYREDFRQIESLLPKDSLVLSDLATSYYAAAVLPAYVINIHRHHGRDKRKLWTAFVAKHHVCYFERDAVRAAFLRELEQHLSQIRVPQLQLGYFILNKDKDNRNLRDDCLSLRSGWIAANIDWIADLQYAGEYLNLYRFK